MFGWEFPPHISGGLGTACYGLTKALTEQGVEVIFVVPTLMGDEPVNAGVLVGASSVKVKNTRKYGTGSRSYSLKHSEQEPLLTTIEVPADLAPYNLAHLSTPVSFLEYWNDRSLTEEIEREIPGSEKPDRQEYNFKGGYGPQLIEEVFRYADVAAEIASATSFDVIHAHDWMTYPAGIAAKRLSGKPLVVHVHATEYDRSGHKGNQLVYTIEKEGLDEADRVVTVSQWTKDTLVTKYEINADKIDVVYNGVTADVQPRHAQVCHPLGAQIVTFMGRITYQKGPEYFVEAAEKVLKVFPDTHFIMAGAGDFLPQVIEKVARLRMSGRFHFTGFLKKKEINKVLSCTSIYVMPSVSEPFGITPLEAIQHGVPVILSNQSGVTEVMPHALKVDFWDTDALSQAICSILRYESLSLELKKNAGVTITGLSWKKAAKNLNNLYYELIHKN